MIFLNKIMNIFKQKKTIPYLIFLAVVIIFLAPAIFSEQTFYAFDILFGYSPWSDFVDKDFFASNRLISDPVDGLYPGHYYLNYLYIQQNLQLHNQLPQWYDNSFAGFPFGYAYSYPLMFLLKYISIHSLHLLNIFGCLLISAIGMYHYCRELKVSNYVAMFAGIAWMLNGYISVWLEFEIVLFTAASLPLILYCYEKMKNLNKFSLWYTALTFFAIGLSFAGSYGHLLIYQYLFIGCYIIPDIIKNRQDFKKNIKAYIYIGISYILSIATVLPFLVSHLKILEYAQRQKFPYSQLFTNTGQLYPSWLVTWLTPDAFGSPAFGADRFQIPQVPSQVYNNYCELAIYSGIAVFFFVIFCLLRLKRNWGFFYVITLIITLLMAAGSGLYYPLIKLIPALSFSAPIRILYLSNFCFVICAVFGLDNFCKYVRLFNRPRYSQQKKNLFIFTLSWAVILIIVILCIKSDYGYELRFGKDFAGPKAILGEKNYYIYYKSIILIMATTLISLALIKQELSMKIALIALTLLLSYDLYIFGRTFNTLSHKDMAYTPTPATKFLVAQKQLNIKYKSDDAPFRVTTFGDHLPNYLAGFDIASLAGYSSFYSKNVGDYLFAINNNAIPAAEQNYSRWQMFSSLNLKLSSLANIKYIITPKTQRTVKHQALELIYNKEVKIYRNKLSFERVYFTANEITVINKSEVYNLLLKMPLNDLKNTAILIGDKKQQKRQPLADAKVNFSKVNSDCYAITVDAPVDGGLVVSNCYDKNWQYRLDGKWQSVQLVNGFMQYIKVKRGKHNIILKYRDKNLQQAISINKTAWKLFLIALIFILIKPFLKHKKFSRQKKKKSIVT